MNATQTQIGGERKSMGRWIDRWLGGTANPARGRTRTRATLSVEGLEGRVVMSGVSTVGATAIQNLASVIVQYSENLVLQQPQKLASVISYLESSQELTSMLNIVGIQSNASGENMFLQTGVQDTEFALVEIDVSLDLLAQPTSAPSADVASAFVTSFANAVTSVQNALNNFSIYNIINAFDKPSQPSAASLNNSTAPQSFGVWTGTGTTPLSQLLDQTVLSLSTNSTNPALGNTTQSQTGGLSPNGGNAIAVASQAVTDLKNFGSNGIANLYGSAQTFSAAATAPMNPETPSNPYGLPSWDTTGIYNSTHDLEFVWI